jgi:hypothetical protein
MDMGEALDTNKELATVGICNVMSGALFGFTGSYIECYLFLTFHLNPIVFNFPFESDCIHRFVYFFANYFHLPNGCP